MKHDIPYLWNLWNIIYNIANKYASYLKNFCANAEFTSDCRKFQSIRIFIFFGKAKNLMQAFDEA